MEILSLSGGGVQGLYICGILRRLQDRGIGDIDLIAGTSIGGALAACWSFGFDMADIEHRFLSKAPLIFSSLGIGLRVEKTYRGVRGIVSARYSVEPWRDLLEDFFGDKLLSQSEIPIVIPSIRFSDGSLRLFASWHDESVRVVDAILASSADPVFFDISIQWGMVNWWWLGGECSGYGYFNESLDNFWGIVGFDINGIGWHGFSQSVFRTKRYAWQGDNALGVQWTDEGTVRIQLRMFGIFQEHFLVVFGKRI